MHLYNFMNQMPISMVLFPSNWTYMSTDLLPIHILATCTIAIWNCLDLMCLRVVYHRPPGHPSWWNHKHPHYKYYIYYMYIELVIYIIQSCSAYLWMLAYHNMDEYIPVVNMHACTQVTITLMIEELVYRSLLEQCVLGLLMQSVNYLFELVTTSGHQTCSYGCR